MQLLLTHLCNSSLEQKNIIQNLKIKNNGSTFLRERNKQMYMLSTFVAIAIDLIFPHFSQISALKLYACLHLKSSYSISRSNFKHSMKLPHRNKVTCT